MPADTSHIPKISEIVSWLKKSRSVLFITGAGISADSGLPTYRGIGGLYDNAITEEGLAIETVLGGEMLRRHPEITWKYLSQIEERCRSTKFNRGHEVIAEMENHFGRLWVLTQNIDGFHNAAGSRNVIDIHGDMHKLSCIKCAWRSSVKDYSQTQAPPKCPECNGNVRPEVVFFGEMLPLEKLQVLSRELRRGFDIYFAVGTTAVFPYIQQPILDAKFRGRPVVEINPGDTQISYLADVALRMRAAEALDLIFREYAKKQ